MALNNILTRPEENRMVVFKGQQDSESLEMIPETPFGLYKGSEIAFHKIITTNNIQKEIIVETPIVTVEKVELKAEYKIELFDTLDNTSGKLARLTLQPGEYTRDELRQNLLTFFASATVETNGIDAPVDENTFTLRAGAIITFSNNYVYRPFGSALFQINDQISTLTYDNGEANWRIDSVFETLFLTVQTPTRLISRTIDFSFSLSNTSMSTDELNEIMSSQGITFLSFEQTGTSKTLYGCGGMTISSHSLLANNLNTTDDWVSPDPFDDITVTLNDSVIAQEGTDEELDYNFLQIKTTVLGIEAGDRVSRELSAPLDSNGFTSNANSSFYRKETEIETSIAFFPNIETRPGVQLAMAFPFVVPIFFQDCFQGFIDDAFTTKNTGGNEWPDALPLEGTWGYRFDPDASDFSDLHTFDSFEILKTPGDETLFNNSANLVIDQNTHTLLKIIHVGTDGDTENWILRSVARVQYTTTGGQIGSIRGESYPAPERRFDFLTTLPVNISERFSSQTEGGGVSIEWEDVADPIITIGCSNTTSGIVEEKSSNTIEIFSPDAIVGQYFQHQVNYPIFYPLRTTQVNRLQINFSDEFGNNIRFRDRLVVVLLIRPPQEKKEKTVKRRRIR